MGTIFEGLLDQTLLPAVPVIVFIAQTIKNLWSKAKEGELPASASLVIGAVCFVLSAVLTWGWAMTHPGQSPWLQGFYLFGASMGTLGISVIAFGPGNPPTVNAMRRYVAKQPVKLRRAAAMPPSNDRPHPSTPAGRTYVVVLALALFAAGTASAELSPGPSHRTLWRWSDLVYGCSGADVNPEEVGTVMPRDDVDELQKAAHFLSMLRPGPVNRQYWYFEADDPDEDAARGQWLAAELQPAPGGGGMSETREPWDFSRATGGVTAWGHIYDWDDEMVPSSSGFAGDVWLSYSLTSRLSAAGSFYRDFGRDDRSLRHMRAHNRISAGGRLLLASDARKQIALGADWVRYDGILDDVDSWTASLRFSWGAVQNDGRDIIFVPAKAEYDVDNGLKTFGVGGRLQAFGGN